MKIAEEDSPDKMTMSNFPTAIFTVIEKATSNRLLWYFAWGCLLFLMHWVHWIHTDEGAVLADAWSIYNGKKIYQDFFSYIAPGTSYFTSFLIKVFGADYLTIKAIFLVLLYIGVVGIERISSLIFEPPLTFLAGFVFILSTNRWPIINHNTLHIIIAIWTVYFLLFAFKNGGPNFLYAAGLLAGSSCWVLQSRGVYLTLGVILAAALVKALRLSQIAMEQYLKFLVLTIVPIVTMPIFLGMVFFQNLLLFPITRYEGVNKLPPVILLPLLVILSLLLPWVIKNKKPVLTGMWLIQLFLFLSIANRADLFYSSLVLFPLIILIICYFQGSSREPLLKRAYPVVFVFGSFILAIKLVGTNRFNLESLIPIFISIFCGVMIYLFIDNLKKSGDFKLNYIFLFVLLGISLLHFYFDYQQKKHLSKNTRQFINRLEQHCSGSQSLYSGPFLPNYYFELRKHNPTSFNIMVTGLNTEEQFFQAAKELNMHPPECAIFDFVIVQKFLYNKRNPVDDFFRKNYHLVESSGQVEIWKINHAALPNEQSVKR